MRCQIAIAIAIVHIMALMVMVGFHHTRLINRDLSTRLDFVNSANGRQNAKMWRQSSLKALVYADVDLNYIDGSATWTASIVELLAGLPQTKVRLLLKAPLRRDTVVASLERLSNVVIISPESLTNSSTASRLDAPKAAKMLTLLHRQEGFDLVVLRGVSICLALAQEPEFQGILAPYLVEVFQKPDPWDNETLAAVTSIARASRTLFCQTENIRTRLEMQVPDARGRTTLLPPMVPYTNHPSSKSEWLPGTPLRIVYSGKFAPLWGSREMFETIRQLRQSGFSCELHVYGDKIHNPPEDPSFNSEIRQALESSDGVIWHGATTRQEILDVLPIYDIAWAWRHPDLETHTDEVSTKLLEYGSAGLPVIIFGSHINRHVLGEDYPLFVNEAALLPKTLMQLTIKPHILTKAGQQATNAIKPFTFAYIRERYMGPILEVGRHTRRMPTVLIAGHDLKFISNLIQPLRRDGYRILIDKWISHNQHDEQVSWQLLENADVVLCEWCLGNAVWYSQRIREDQRLLVRFHSQELRVDYARHIDMQRVANMIFIAPHVKRKAIEIFDWANYTEKFRFIWNSVDANRLNKPKFPTSRYTLGIVGVVPRMKRLDRVLDILEELIAVQPRFTLRIKGKLAHEFPWMANRPEEMQYFQEQDERINNSSVLRNRVFFDGHGNDMDDWFQQVGYILSTSDYEGSHVSVAEGMASGSIPIILHWDGADELYPKESCFNDISSAAARIRYYSDLGDDELQEIRSDCIIFMHERCDISSVSKQIETVLGSR